jgi:3-hydroxybutyryl-CoA dehydratase
VTQQALPVDDRKVYEYTKTITDEDIQNFAKATGDYQPLHVDDEKAGQSRFKKRIAHGILTAGLISTVLGMKVAPNHVVIYMGQTLQFLAPVYVGDTLTASLRVISVNAPRGQYTFAASVKNQDGVEVVKGETRAMVEAFAQ